MPQKTASNAQTIHKNEWPPPVTVFSLCSSHPKEVTLCSVKTALWSGDDQSPPLSSQVTSLGPKETALSASVGTAVLTDSRGSKNGR